MSGHDESEALERAVAQAKEAQAQSGAAALRQKERLRRLQDREAAVARLLRKYPTVK
jgi:hypothetical protein